LILVVSAVVFLLMHLLFSSEKFKYSGFVFIAGIGLTCNCAAFFSLSHTERDNAKALEKILDNQQGLVAGNATTFSLTFLSSSSAMHFPKSPYWKSTKPAFLGAYSTSDQDSIVTIEMLDQLKHHYPTKPELRCIPLSVWSTRQYGSFCYPLRKK
jgi:Co/Zn/Cd efflux system component